MKEESLVALLRSAGEFELAVSANLDERISRTIFDSRKKEPYRFQEKLSSLFRLQYGISLLLVLILTGSLLKMRVDSVREDALYRQIIAEIISINEKKDVKRAMNIYSEDFFRQNRKADIRKNIEELFGHYSTIRYLPEKMEVVVRKDRILIRNKVRYSALPRDREYAPILLQGRERIYLKKDRDEWKITAWVLDK
ncbi:MAG: hypothetical protein PHF84_03830 [bacterium]|nr:hypothetical protein [bacterium]